MPQNSGSELSTLRWWCGHDERNWMSWILTHRPPVEKDNGCQANVVAQLSSQMYHSLMNGAVRHVRAIEYQLPNKPIPTIMKLMKQNMESTMCTTCREIFPGVRSLLYQHTYLVQGLGV